VDLDLALKLLALPREVGKHPDDGEAVIAANGRFGPYVRWKQEIRSIPAEFSPLDIALDEAVGLLRQPKGQRRAAKASTLRELGKHPITDLPMAVRSGRYGPYVTDGKINASLRKGMSPETISLDDAVNLLEARAGQLEAPSAPVARKRARKETAASGPKKARSKK
jgi:DNA topoisomerase-1